MTDTIPVGIAKAVIAQDSQPTRFESFCNQLLSEVEGDIPILSTSQSWDSARDGRSVGRNQGIYTCCSLTDEVDEKARADLNRLIKSTRPIKKVYYCSSQPLSEHRVNQLKAALLGVVSNEVETGVLGCLQLSELGIRFPNSLKKNYRAEVENCLAALKGVGNEATAESTGLRLALLTTNHENSIAVRHGIYRSCLLSVLLDGKPRTLNECCKDVAAVLRLGRNLSSEALRPHLERLRTANEIRLDGERYVVTPPGQQFLQQAEDIAAEKLLEGRQLIRNSIEIAIGSKLADDHYNVLWKVLQDRLAHLFYSHGQRMVGVISKLISSKSTDDSPDEVAGSPFFIPELADSVAQTSSLESQREELRTAITDIFTERNGPAFEWLVRIASGFVALCSLGVEDTTSKAIAGLVSRMALVFDTDVILSLLSEGEPAHAAVAAIVQRWRALGGQLLMAEPVLHETAYHAHIAEKDYQEVKHWLPGTEDDRLRIIDNAFVRGFAKLLSAGAASKNHWPQYIRQYLGKDANDLSKIGAVLHDEYGFEELLPRSSREIELEKRVATYLIERAHATFQGPRISIAIDKAKRDAQLYSAMVRQHRALRSADPNASCFLLSSARRLVEVEQNFREVGEAYMVVSVSMVIYMLSLVPGVSIGLTAMSAFLFGERRVRFTNDLDRTLLRVVHDASELDIPWAKRTALFREVRNRLLDDAKKSGEKVTTDAQRETIEREAIKKENLPRTIQILKDSLDALAIDSRLEQENRLLKKQVADLQGRLDDLKKS